MIPQARGREGRWVVAKRHVQAPSKDSADTARHFKATPSCRAGPVAAAATASGHKGRHICSGFEHEQAGRRQRWGGHSHRAGTGTAYSSPTNSAVRPTSTHGHTVPSRQMCRSRAQSYRPRSSGDAGLSSSTFHASPIRPARLESPSRHHCPSSYACRRCAPFLARIIDWSRHATHPE